VRYALEGLPVILDMSLTRSPAQEHTSVGNLRWKIHLTTIHADALPFAAEAVEVLDVILPETLDLASLGRIGTNICEALEPTPLLDNSGSDLTNQGKSLVCLLQSE